MEDELNSLSEELRDYVIQREDFSVEKIIAEGGHGKVYFARNKTNQISCALKELNVEAFNDKTIKEYKQEIKVMSLSNNFFVVPFVGFTTKHPYTIITRFIPNGSVYEALHSTDSSKKLTGTQKTIIALGVAAGMAHLHSRGIIHRDLKSLNVLLDSKTYPKICDFGLSHFDTDSSIIDQNTGTPHLMAPELFESKPYTNKVDVYSYGILLYELLTSKIPFNGMTSLQIMNAVCIEKKRPKIPDSAPEKLKFLINLCWSQNPDFRPSFDSIYQLFADHKVGFDQTDFNEVDKLISEFSSMSDKYSNSIAYRYSKDIVNDQNEEDIINYISIIEFGDKDSIEICAKTLLLKQIPNFFEAVRYFLKNTKNEIPILKDLLIIILKMITTNTKNTKAFANSGIIDILPFNSDYYKISFSILEPVIEIYPRTVTEDIIEAIFAFSESDPLKVLRLSKIVSLHFDSLEKTKWFFANELMNRSETFMNTKYSLLYIRILRQILQNSSIFRDSRIEKISKIFVKFLGKSDNKKEIYLELAAIRPETLDIDPSSLSKDLSNENRVYVLNLLSNTVPRRVSTELIETLAKPDHELVKIALLKISGAHNSIIIKTYGKWSKCVSSIDTIKILACCATSKQYKQEILQIENLPSVISKALEDKTRETLVIVKEFLKFIGISKDFVVELQKFDFVKKLLTYSDDSENLYSVFAILDRILRLSFTKDCLDFIKIAKDSLNTNYLQKPSLSFLSLICALDQQAKSSVISSGVINTLKSANISDNSAQLAEILSNNLL